MHPGPFPVEGGECAEFAPVCEVDAVRRAPLAGHEAVVQPVHDLTCRMASRDPQDVATRQW